MIRSIRRRSARRRRRRRARRRDVTAIIGQGINNVIKGTTVTALIALRINHEKKRI